MESRVDHLTAVVCGCYPLVVQKMGPYSVDVWSFFISLMYELLFSCIWIDYKLYIGFRWCFFINSRSSEFIPVLELIIRQLSYFKEKRYINRVKIYVLKTYFHISFNPLWTDDCSCPFRHLVRIIISNEGFLDSDANASQSIENIKDMFYRYCMRVKYSAV